MNIIEEFDTIAAISTPIGTGGVGVIRISGDRSFDIVLKISDQKNLPTGKICHGWILDGNKKIDEVIILPFKAPNSYTGEDVIEIQCHGGIYVVRNILDIVLKNGARMAQRGEFTKRAFLNKKLDLSQAEAVDDLIHSKTSEFAVQSAKNLSGVLAQKIKEIRTKVFEIASRIVAGIDFPEDVAEPEYSYLIEHFEKSLKEIDEILKSAKSSDILRQGIKIAIAGRPNVGKSSLFNSLGKKQQAIVSSRQGTTRDVNRIVVKYKGREIEILDTAGLRRPGKREVGIEKFSAIRTLAAIEEADICCLLIDANEPHVKLDQTLAGQIVEAG